MTALLQVLDCHKRIRLNKKLTEIAIHDKNMKNWSDTSGAFPEVGDISSDLAVHLLIAAERFLLDRLKVSAFAIKIIKTCRFRKTGVQQCVRSFAC